jgi:hypothetical protein
MHPDACLQRQTLAGQTDACAFLHRRAPGGLAIPHTSLSMALLAAGEVHQPAWLKVPALSADFRCWSVFSPDVAKPLAAAVR